MKLHLDDEGIDRARAIRSFYQNDHIIRTVESLKSGLFADFMAAETDEGRRACQSEYRALDKLMNKLRTAVDELEALEEQEHKRRQKASA